MITSVTGYEFWECDNCAALTKVEKGLPPLDGYFLTIRRLQSGRRGGKYWSRTTEAEPWFCSIVCFKDGIKWHSYTELERVREQ